LGKTGNDDLLKAMDVFGGGLGAHGEVCGAVIGGLAVIGLMFGRSNGNNSADSRMWKFAHEFMRRFREEVTDGKILCRDIVDVNWMDQNQVKEYRQGQKKVYCKTLTGKTARLIGEIIDQAASG
jgi:C_GCAxxG_C_C family probable redox protein